MRVLIAPDKFKGSLTAVEAAEAMRAGALRARPDLEVDMCPLSDGGDGFVAVALAAAPGRPRRTRVTGPTGVPVEAKWAMLATETAILESAAVIGTALVPEPPSPCAYTTYGIGELLLESIGAGARQVVIGLGGSTTNDGGIGMAQALGVRFVGGGRPLRGDDLGALLAIDTSGRDTRLKEVAVLAATDVDNPLAGPHGASRVYGPQKGARADEITDLDKGLKHLATLCKDPGERPGDGAAGGLGYGLRMFAGANVVSGSTWVLDLVRFDERVERCDLVITGEGRLDEQSVHGKVIGAVCRRCKARGIPVAAIAGSVVMTANDQAKLGLERSIALSRGRQEQESAFRNASGFLEAATERFVRERGDSSGV